MQKIILALGESQAAMLASILDYANTRYTQDAEEERKYPTEDTPEESAHKQSGYEEMATLAEQWHSTLLQKIKEKIDREKGAVEFFVDYPGSAHVELRQFDSLAEAKRFAESLPLGAVSGDVCEMHGEDAVAYHIYNGDQWVRCIVTEDSYDETT
jgi:hypothetical protein